MPPSALDSVDEELLQGRLDEISKLYAGDFENKGDVHIVTHKAATPAANEDVIIQVFCW